MKRVAIIGAGSVGLAAAAHVLSRNMEPIVLEAGEDVAHAVRQWSHVRMFSPWKYNIDKASKALLDEAGWNAPEPEAYPTGGELVAQYLEPLAKRTKLKNHVHFRSKVYALGREGFDKVKSAGRESAPFEVRYQNGQGPSILFADAVIDASGTWAKPGPAGANGVEAVGEKEVRHRINYGMPDILGAARERYANKRVAVVGAGHSAIGNILDLVKLKDAHPSTTIVWLLRGTDPAKSFGGGINDKLAARGELGKAFADVVASGKVQVETGFRVGHLCLHDDALKVATSGSCCARHIEVDELIVSTGFRPQLDFLSELRLSLDPALECPPELAPLIDPNLHSCGTVRPHGARELAQPESGFYFAGMKSYGRAPTFLMLTGYEQVRSIAADIAGDKEAASRVELELPETGVCSRHVAVSSKDAGCCGGRAPAQVDACCVADAKAKVAGKKGCGC
jgi:Pyridine nucleotide-disulphide oxidoreductase